MDYTKDKISKTLTKRFKAEISAIDGAHLILFDFLGDIPVSKNTLCECRLLLDEALVNAVEHGSLVPGKEVEMTLQLVGSFLHIRVTDFGGHQFNPVYFEQLATSKSWGIGGRGIRLIKEIADEVYFVFNRGASTLVVMIKNLGIVLPAS